MWDNWCSLTCHAVGSLIRGFALALIVGTFFHVDHALAKATVDVLAKVPHWKCIRSIREQAVLSLSMYRKPFSVDFLTFLTPFANVGFHTRARKLCRRLGLARATIEAGVWVTNIWRGRGLKGKSTCWEERRSPEEQKQGALTDIQEVNQPIAQVENGHRGIGAVLSIIYVCQEQSVDRK